MCIIPGHVHASASRKMIITCLTTLVSYLSLDISVLTNLLLHVTGKMCQQMQDQCIVLYFFLLST